MERRCWLRRCTSWVIEKEAPGDPCAPYSSARRFPPGFGRQPCDDGPCPPVAISETTSLAEHTVGYQLDPAMISTLHHETEGNPLFVVEMMRAGTLEQCGREQHITESPLPLLTQPASTLPPTVQTVLSTRLAQLSPLAHEVANVAAVIGREFAFAERATGVISARV